MVVSLDFLKLLRSEIIGAIFSFLGLYIYMLFLYIYVNLKKINVFVLKILQEQF